MDLVQLVGHQQDRYALDERILLETFPLEIWLLILEQVNDDNSLEAIANSSPFLHKIFETKLQILLFPKVWKIYQAVMHPTECSRGTQYYRRGLLSHSAKCRLVCKSWCDSIDNYYQTLPIYRTIPDDMLTRHEFKWAITSFSGLQLMQVKKHFLSTHDATCSRSPFITRAVEIAVCDEDRDYRFMVACHFEYNREGVPDEQVKLEDMLIKYGNHFWHCDLTANLTANARLQQQVFTRSLELMPNLKTLRVYYFLEVDIPNALPRLRQLDLLSVKNIGVQVAQALLPACTNIKSLEIRGVRFSREFHFASLAFTNLNQLSWNCDRAEDFEFLESTLVNWPVTKLNLDFDRTIFIQWSRIINVLKEKWGSTLTSLELSLPEPDGISAEDQLLLRQTSSAPTMNLRNVKDLKLKFRNIHSLNFIFPMQKNLKNLEIDIFLPSRNNDENDVSGQLIQFEGYMNRMLGPGIWRTFPKLKTINVDLQSDINPYKKVNWEKIRPTG